jgi:hypothetical protein
MATLPPWFEPLDPFVEAGKVLLGPLFINIKGFDIGYA